MNFAIKIILLIVGFFLLLVVGVALLTPEPQTEQKISNISLSGFGSSGGDGYAIFSHSDKGNLTLISYSFKPKKQITLVTDKNAIEAKNPLALIEILKPLENYSYKILTNSSTFDDGIYIVPTGAMPDYVLEALRTKNSSVIYFGSTDLLIQNGIKKRQWLTDLDESAKKRLIIYPMTLDEYLEKRNFSLIDDILYQKWSLENKKTLYFDGSNLTTLSIPINSSYLRIVSNSKLFDSELLKQTPTINITPNKVYPMGKINIEYTLNKTNGSGYISVKKDTKIVFKESYTRISDENTLIKKLQFEEPGDYIVEITDNSGVIASGIIHVYDLRFNYIETRGYSYIFSATLDGTNISESDVYVSLNNDSEGRKFYIEKGLIAVSAKIPKGTSTFYFNFNNYKHSISVENNSEDLLEFYLKYGSIGVFLILIVYLFAKFSRKKVYIIKIDDSQLPSRKNIVITVSEIMDLFKSIYSGLPISASEFSSYIRNNYSKGAEITDGNIEAILQKLVKLNLLENYYTFFQIPIGSVRRNSFLRQIQDQLIENGIDSELVDSVFISKDYTISFESPQIGRKSICVFENLMEIDKYFKNLDNIEFSKIQLSLSNGFLKITTIEKLGELL